MPALVVRVSGPSGSLPAPSPDSCAADLAIRANTRPIPGSIPWPLLKPAIRVPRLKAGLDQYRKDRGMMTFQPSLRSTDIFRSCAKCMAGAGAAGRRASVEGRWTDCHRMIVPVRRGLRHTVVQLPCQFANRTDKQFRRPSIRSCESCDIEQRLIGGRTRRRQPGRWYGRSRVGTRNG